MNWNEYYFTRNGMFPYTEEDNRKIQERLRKSKPDGKIMDFEENLQFCSNAI